MTGMKVALTGVSGFIGWHVLAELARHPVAVTAVTWDALPDCASRGSQAGAMYDVIIDLRSDSCTFKQWVAKELTADNRCVLYIPEGFAHGFQTLVEDTEIFCQMSESYHPKSARGVRWNDPAFSIEWPLALPILSEKDRTCSDFSSQA